MTIAEWFLCTVRYNVKPEKICTFITKFITALTFLVDLELTFAHFERGMWPTLVTSFK